MAKRKDPLVWGLILVGLGLVFILENFHVDAWDYVWRFWPVILIVWGADKLYRGLKERNIQPDAPAPDKGHEI